MKNLKNSIRLLGLFIFLTGSQPVFAQGNVHTEKDKKEQTRQEQKEKEIRDAYKQKIKNAKGQEKKELEEELEREIKQFQEKAKKNKGQDNANENQKKAKKNNKVEKGQPDSKVNQGNAYGKNKGGLEGREFGQARAADARAKVNQYNNRLTEKRQVVILGKRKIEGARIRLAAHKKNNTLSPTEIAERETRILVFERRVNAFEAALEDALRKNEAQRAQLVLFYDQD